jgi:hypothetical protein
VSTTESNMLLTGRVVRPGNADYPAASAGFNLLFAHHPDAELEKDALREIAKILSPTARRRAVDMLKDALIMSELLACKAVGLARSTYR